MEIIITYKQMKYMRLKVKEGKAIVSAPFFTSKKTIEKFVNEHQNFIKQQVEKQERRNNALQINYHDCLNLLGKEYEILPSEHFSKKTEHYLFISTKEIDKRKVIKKLLSSDICELLQEITKFYYKKMSILKPIPNVSMKDVKSKWGSYNRQNNSILYSLELIFKERELYDYIVVHELSHMIEFNHSKAFYAIVEKYCPNYKSLRKQLKGEMK